MQLHKGLAGVTVLELSFDDAPPEDEASFKSALQALRQLACGLPCLRELWVSGMLSLWPLVDAAQGDRDECFALSGMLVAAISMEVAAKTPCHKFIWSEALASVASVISGMPR